MNIIVIKLFSGGISMRISSSDITVKINYPEQYEWDEKIQSTIAKWILKQQIENYGSENLELAYDIWIRIKKMEINGSEYEHASKKILSEYANRNI